MAGTALFLLAHHDDEVFCAGRLAQARMHGRVVLLWATAGGIAPGRRRIAEGRRVTTLLRLPPQDAVDLAYPDQGAVRNIEGILAAARDALVTGEPPVTVYVTAYEGGHPDHDAMNLVAASLRREGALGLARGATPSGPADVRFVEFPLYRSGRWGMTVRDPMP